MLRLSLVYFITFCQIVAMKLNVSEEIVTLSDRGVSGSRSGGGGVLTCFPVVYSNVGFSFNQPLAPHSVNLFLRHLHSFGLYFELH